MIKTCANCGKIFEGDGRYRYCSDECRKEASETLRKAYYQNHKEQLRSNGRKHYYDHKEYYQIHAKRYYQDHKEQIRVYNKDYYQKHKNKLKCGGNCFSCPYEDCIY